MVRSIKAVFLAVASTAILASTAAAKDYQRGPSNLAELKAELNQLNLAALSRGERINLSKSYRKTFEELLATTNYDEISADSTEYLVSFEHLSKNIPCFLDYMQQSDLEAPYSCA